MIAIAASEPEAVWFPPNAATLVPGDETVLMIVTGESGVGKSHLALQLLRDPDYGPDRVGIIMSEKSLASYDTPGARYNKISDLASADDVIAAYKRAFTLGKKLPAVLFYDSLSASCDAQMLKYAADSPFTGASGKRDKLAEYGDLAQEALEKLSNLRNELPCDIVVIVRTRERGGRLAPELALPGKVIPDNLTGWSDVTFYMKAEYKKFSDEERTTVEAKLASFRLPHRTFGTDETGKWDSTMIQRFFYTQNTGEVLAKGHHNLMMKERAILPDVLRAIHGKARKY